MSQTDKPSLADIARKNNSARTSKFASSMVPAPPQMTPEADTPPAEVSDSPVESIPTEVPATATEVKGADVAKSPKPAITLDELKTSMGATTVREPNLPPVTTELATSSRPARRRTAAMSLSDDILTPKAPDEEAFGKMTRIAEKHHDLLRKIAFEHRKPMNTILYNLLEMLDQTYQRDQQKDV